MKTEGIDEVGVVEVAAVRQLKAQLESKWGWKAYAFEIKRRADRGSINRPVKPRVVVVYAPIPEGAELGVGVASDEEFRKVPVPLLSHLSVSGQPSRRDMGDLFEAVGSAVRSGRSAKEAFGQAARVVRSPRLRGIIGTIVYAINQGQDIHIALSLFPRQFGPMIVALVAAAHKSGADQASQMYLKLAKNLQKQGKIMRQFIGAVAYPVGMILLSLVGTMILAMKALPMFAELFVSMGAKLPAVTQFYFDVSKILLGFWWIIFPAIIFGTVGIFSAIPVLLKRPSVQRLVVKLPFVGSIMLCLAISRALSTFVLLRTHGAKPKDTFLLAGAASGNVIIADFFDAAYRRVVGGEDVAAAITAERDALGEDGQRIAGKIEVGVEGGDLNLLIGSVVEELEERSELKIAVLPKALNLPLLVVCVAMIGGVALAISLPFPELIAKAAQDMNPKR